MHNTSPGEVTPLHTNRLGELRRTRGLSRAHVAVACGRTESQIARYETGQSVIPDPVKAVLAAHFGVSRSHLMGWDDDEQQVAAA